MTVNLLLDRVEEAIRQKRLHLARTMLDGVISDVGWADDRIRTLHRTLLAEIDEEAKGTLRWQTWLRRVFIASATLLLLAPIIAILLSSMHLPATIELTVSAEQASLRIRAGGPLLLLDSVRASRISLHNFEEMRVTGSARSIRGAAGSEVVIDRTPTLNQLIVYPVTGQPTLLTVASQKPRGLRMTIGRGDARVFISAGKQSVRCCGKDEPLGLADEGVPELSVRGLEIGFTTVLWGLAEPLEIVPGVVVDDVRFQRGEWPNVVSTVRSGKIVFLNLDMEREIRDRDFLTVGKLRNFELKRVAAEDLLTLTFVGEVGDLEAGGRTAATGSLLPTALDAIRARYSWAGGYIGFLLIVITAGAGIAQPLISWWRSGD